MEEKKEISTNNVYAYLDFNGIMTDTRLRCVNIYWLALRSRLE